MSFEYGKNIRLTIFGQSHSVAIGFSLDGLPPGLKIDMEKIKKFMSRRAPGDRAGSTHRRESDELIILSGLADGFTCGSPLCMIIENKDCKSSDYENLGNIPRPMHADYPAWVKYNGMNDKSGGGHFSGRMTAPLCAAGAICSQFLEKKEITVGAHIASVGTEYDSCFDPVNITKEQLQKLTALNGTELPVINSSTGEKIESMIKKAAEAGDSVGGIIECCILGLPVGIGDTMFDSLEGQLSRLLFSIPGIKGVEFGSGFAGTRMLGSQHNDSYYFDSKKQIRTRTNNHGGILGGLSTGMPVLFRAAVKPTPSIGLPQESVDFKSGMDTELMIKGRHDACIVPRAVPCIEAAALIVVMDNMLESGRLKWI